MSIPKNPRDLMIQLMYLVYTALLALNVTKEVLDAFDIINDSIETSNSAIQDKNTRLYQAFQTVGDKDPDQKRKAVPYLEKAQIVKAESEKVYKYLGSWKDSVIIAAGGWVEEPGKEKKIKAYDNIDASSRLFIEEEKGKLVRKTLDEYKQKMLTLFEDPEVRKQVEQELPLAFKETKKTESNPTGDWAYATFHNVPVVGVVTIFSKFQNDIKNTESILVSKLMSMVSDDVDLDVFKVDAFMPVAVPNTSYALAGDEITANIALAAYNKSMNPTISSSAGAVQVQDGVGTLKFRASGTGVQTVRGKISITTHGKTESKDWSFNYTVGTAGASLQLDKMNVMYIGVPNPISLSASGYDINDVTLNMPGAQLTKTGNGQYNVIVTSPNVQGVDYTINAKNKQGQVVKVGGGKMRVKQIPPPNVQFADITSFGKMATGKAKAQMGLLAKLENFDFDAKYQVKSFEFIRQQKNSDEILTYNSNSALFEGQVRRAMDESRPGDTWIFTKITAIGPDNIVKPVKGSVTVILN